METETLGTSQECQADDIRKSSAYNATTGSYKGNPTITINEGEKRVVSFGLKKAKAIVAQYEEIKKFVDANDKGNQNNEGDQG